MWKGEVAGIYLRPEKSGPTSAATEAEAIAGEGLKGDHQVQRDNNDPEREITLIEEEALAGLKREDGIDLSPAETRRNILTRGVPLNHLVEREFRVGEVRLRGIELCEPCDHLQKMTQPGVLKGLLHRGGLRAQILEGGRIRQGDAIEEA
jgi:MOSC domain-containing protein YiiM